MPYTIDSGGNLETDYAAITDATSPRSEALTEIVYYKPGFMIRYGTGIFLLVLLLIVLCCWLIRYPDIVAGKAVLTSVNAPKPVVAKTDGKLVMLRMEEDAPVQEGDVMGFIESTASHTQVMALSAYLDTLAMLLQNNRDAELVKQKERNFGNLGELQPFFQTFEQSFTDYSNYIADGFFVKKATLLSADKAYLQQQNALLLAQKKMQQQDLDLAEKTFAMNDTLMKQKVISALEYRNEQSKYLSKQQAIPQLNASIIANENGQNDKDKEIAELRNTAQQQMSIFVQVLNTLKSEVENWKRKYLLTATATGTISLTGFLEVNQPVKSGQTLCYISSAGSHYYAQMLIPQANFGKVKRGEDVLLKFEAYPSAEWGSVQGKVDFVSHVPTDSGYLAKIILPNGLQTDYNRQVQYHDGLMATGQIITADKRLIEQLYHTLYTQVSR